MSFRLATAAFFTAAIAVTSFASPSAHAQTELRNDGFEDGMAVGVQLGFAVGEEAAVTLVPSGPGPHTVQKVTLLFGGATTTQDVTIKIYDDSNLTTAPGAPLFSGEFQLTGSDNMLNEVDLTGDNVVVPGPFRVSLEFQHTGAPSIARDDDGTNTAGRNWIEEATVGWVASGTLGVPGDWIIRATIAGGGGGGADAGPGGPDAGSDGEHCVLNSDCANGSYCADIGICTQDCRVELDCASGEECNPVGQCVESSSGGCGCQSGDGSSPLGALVLVAMLIAGGRRRRRSRQ